MRCPRLLMLHFAQELQLLCFECDLAYLTTSHFIDVYQDVCQSVWVWVLTKSLEI